MNIAFDLRWAVYDAGGIRRYAEQILRHLGSPEDRFTLVVWAGRERTVRDLVPAQGAVQYLPVGYSPYALRNAVDLLPRLRRCAVDIFHSPGPALPLAGARGGPALVVNIHDLIPYTHPELCPRSLKARFRPVYRWWLGRVIRQAAAVITGSRHAAREIGTHFPQAMNRLHTVYNGVSRTAVDNSGDVTWPVLAARIGVRGPFAFYLGRHDDSKNLEGMIRAFAMVRRTLPAVYFVVAGAPTPLTRRLAAIARSTGCAGAVLFPGAVSDSDARLLFAHARFLAFCSLAEGFGLPVLEAMASGCPVLTSPVTSLPEVAGDAALYADPRSTESMADGMRRLFENAGLRADLVRRGYVRAAQFSWEAAAARLREIYRGVVCRASGTGGAIS